MVLCVSVCVCVCVCVSVCVSGVNMPGIWLSLLRRPRRRWPLRSRLAMQTGTAVQTSLPSAQPAAPEMRVTMRITHAVWNEQQLLAKIADWRACRLLKYMNRDDRVQPPLPSSELVELPKKEAVKRMVEVQNTWVHDLGGQSQATLI